MFGNMGIYLLRHPHYFARTICVSVPRMGISFGQGKGVLLLNFPLKKKNQ